MTGEEMERAIEFLLGNQARFDVRLAETNQQIAETNRQLAQTNQQLAQTNQQLAQTNQQLAQTNQQLDAFAESQALFIQVVTRTFDAQNRINEDSQRNQDAAWAAIRELGVKQDRTEETVNRLAETVRRQIEGRNNGDSGG